jgi:Cof subfamily protein (haloacid dehalogenase superfamily)
MKLIFFDFDDTLFDFKAHRIPESTLRALTRLSKRSDVLLGIASGRGHFSIRDGFPELPMRAYVGCNGQAASLDDAVVLERAIDPQDYASIRTALRERNGSLYVINSFYGLNLIESTTNPTILNDHSVTRLKDYGPSFAHEATVHLMQGAYEAQHDVWFQETFPHLKFYRYYNYMVDIFPKNVSKLAGIEAIAKRLGLGLADVIAIGDGDNDVEMITGCGYGIAMGNGSVNAKAAADYVTRSIEDEGIAHALRHLNLL